MQPRVAFRVSSRSTGQLRQPLMWVNALFGSPCGTYATIHENRWGAVRVTSPIQPQWSSVMSMKRFRIVAAAVAVICLGWGAWAPTMAEELSSIARGGKLYDKMVRGREGR
jgi:hypothetical protein